MFNKEYHWQSSKKTQQSHQLNFTLMALSLQQDLEPEPSKSMTFETKRLLWSFLGQNYVKNRPKSINQFFQTKEHIWLLAGVTKIYAEFTVCTNNASILIFHILEFLSTIQRLTNMVATCSQLPQTPLIFTNIALGPNSKEWLDLSNPTTLFLLDSANQEGKYLLQATQTAL